MNTSDNSNDNITTDYNNSVNSITQTVSIDTTISGQIWIPEFNNEYNVNSSSSDTTDDNQQSIDDNQQSSDPYTQLFIDNPDNPFYKCKINKLDYDTDEEETDKYIRIIATWNYEFNYDFFNILQVKCFITKNSNFKSILNDVKNYRENNNTTTTGLLLKLENNGFKLLDTIHTYLIVYYDNAKCNIELYGIFDQELEDDTLIKNIVNETIYGKTGKIISNTNINSTGGDGFIIIHNLVNIE